MPNQCDDLGTLLWTHSVLLLCAERSAWHGEKLHYEAKAERVLTKVADLTVREEADVGS